MTFKHKGKDNLSVTGFGIAFATASLANLLVNMLIGVVNTMSQGGSVGEYFNALATNPNFSLGGLVLGLAVSFVAGSVLALTYNALLKTKFANKY